MTSMPSVCLPPRNPNKENKMQRTQRIRSTKENEHKVFDLFIESTDYDGMEKAFHSLPIQHRRKQTGSGFSFMDGRRDHHFVVRGYRNANHIIAHYRGLLRKRKRGGCGVYAYHDDKDELKA